MPRPRPTTDIAALAKGGRTNFFGFLLRLAARLPFLFIAGRFYGPELLGRFAYAVIVIELAAQLATLGLKRGLAQQLSTTDQPHVCVVSDGLLAAFIASAVASAILMLFPQAMFPAGDIRGAEWLLPLVIFGIAGADIALAALAYRHDVASTVHVRAIVEPWMISIAAGALIFTHFQRDGLIIAYVVSVVGRARRRLVAAVPQLRPAARLAAQSGRRCSRWRGATCRSPPPTRSNGARAGSTSPSSACSSRRIRRRLLCRAAGRLAAAEAEDQLRSDPRAGHHPEARRGRQGGGRPAGAPGRLLDHRRPGRDRARARHSGRGGDGPGRRRSSSAAPRALAFLLAAEVVAATAAVSEAALVYVARHRNLMISLLMIATQAVLTVAIIVGDARRCRSRRAELQAYQAAGAALALALALGLASILKARLLGRPARRAGPGLALVAGLGGGGGDPGRLRLHRLPSCLEWIELASACR